MYPEVNDKEKKSKIYEIIKKGRCNLSFFKGVI